MFNRWQFNQVGFSGHGVVWVLVRRVLDSMWAVIQRRRRR